MIEKNAVKNWEKILKYNEQIVSSKEKEISEDVRIPFTPIEVRAKALFHLFKLVYPRFINERGGVVDLIVSNDGTKILGLFLYSTPIPGIHTSYEQLDSNLLDLENYSFEGKENIFAELQENIAEKKDLLISHVRIIKEEGIKKINEYLGGIQDTSLQSFTIDFLDLLQSLLQEQLFTIYPEPNVLKFAEEMIALLGPLRASDLFSYIYELIPEINSIVILRSKDLFFIIHLQSGKERNENSNMGFKLWTPQELGLDLEGLKETEIIESVGEKLDFKPIYLFEIEDILGIFKELFELRRPIKLGKLKLLLKKILFGFRNFEIKWFKSPRPLIYNALVRFLMKMIKLNVNLKKIAHWEIPEVIFNSFTRNFGLNSKMGLILTDLHSSKGNNRSEPKHPIISGYDASFLLEFEREALKDIKVIQKEEIVGENEDEISLPEIRWRLSEKCGYISAVLTVDKSLFESTIKDLIFHPTKLNILSRISLIKQWKNEQNFNVYPEFPIFKLIKYTGSYRLLKVLLPILIDWYEF